MGGGRTPGPVDDFASALDVDDGTMIRTESPTPGPIGLDARNGGSNSSQAGMGAQITDFARGRLGHRTGDGQCFALADRALKNAGAKSAADFGSVADDVDYVWGTPTTLADLRAGDVIQFRDYRYDREIETKKADGSATMLSDFQERPHHTAVVERVGGRGAVAVLEQNAPDGSPGRRSQLFFTAGVTTSGDTTTTITVQGTFWFYRPVAR